MADWITSFPLTQRTTEFVKKKVCRVISTGPVPRHVGFIMDGNRRFARQNQMEVKEGHSAGFDSMAKTLETCYDCGVEVATVFAFSIENFHRSSYEVECLMQLGKSKFKQMVGNGEMCDKYGIRIRVLGKRDLLPLDVQQTLREVEEITKNNTRAILNVCWPYTARDDITHGVRQLVKAGGDPDKIDEAAVSASLYTGDSPPLDLLIRTSSVYRLSDFMLWECVDPRCYIEIVPCLWPEFNPTRMAWILLKFGFNRTYYGLKVDRMLNLDHEKDD